ncbi:MAG: AAA family ATPase [Microthrixaceae bacterium]
MRVEALHVRLFKAFNYDFLRLHDPELPMRPWDLYKGVDYPYISVALDREITCIVGANESGKSQLLAAIGYALGAKDPGASDSCRYSMFFGRDGDLSTAQFGLTLDDLGPEDIAALGAIDGLEVPAETSRVHVFRESPDELVVYIGDSKSSAVITGEPLTALTSLLPRTFSIDTKRELPDSVPLSYLIERATNPKASAARRVDRFKFVDSLLENYEQIDQLASASPINQPDLRKLIPAKPRDATDRHLSQFDLAYHLLVTVGGVAPSMFTELHSALRTESEGLTTAIAGKINEQLSRALNMPKWWSQDIDFDLQIVTRDFDLVFTIKDRTAAEYMFAERSEGLKYFLSYLVQYLTRLQEGNPPALLTMDEPDAYLSQQAQQDLLALFQDFINRDRSLPRQVVFVTHSPFLIDRNRPERVRVLSKGIDDEGTRVVKKVSHNHFEPLRSAFGGFVGETTFIGNCNLILEGQIDQIYIAGLCSDASRRRAEPTDFLDLNKITLVAAGGATHVPYMTYLARGRDHDQPAVVVLVDGDDDGDLAVELLVEGIRRGKKKKTTPLINSEFLIQISERDLPGVACDRPGGPREIEDLVPLAVHHQAATALAIDLCGTDDAIPSLAEIQALVAKDVGYFKAVSKAFEASGSELRIDKLGLSRAVIDLLADGAAFEGDATLRNNFKELFRRLRRLQADAEAERSATGSQDAVRRAVNGFLKQHPDRSTRDEVRILLLDLDRLLDESEWADRVRLSKLTVERDLKLTRDLGDDIQRFPEVRKQLEGLLYAADLQTTDSDDTTSVSRLAETPSEPDESTEPFPPVSEVTA